jgi:dTDP-4-dehydrorhamnose 3,5-epimerase
VRVTSTAIPDVLIIDPCVFHDERGFVLESYNKLALAGAAGIKLEFVQDNHSQSVRNVLRGLHYQIMQPQGKLVRVVVGEVLDVAVDIRRSSKTFGKWVSTKLSAENKRMLWVPPGFAHGFIVQSEVADLLYKTTDYRAPQYERSILWSDLTLAIDWQIDGEPLLSAKDQNGMPFCDAEVFD